VFIKICPLIFFRQYVHKYQHSSSYRST